MDVLKRKKGVCEMKREEVSKKVKGDTRTLKIVAKTTQHQQQEE